MFEGTQTLLARAIRNDAKSRRAHVLRAAAPVVLFLFLLQAHYQSYLSGAPGLLLFKSICFINAILITLAGTSYFSSAISEEKEDGTLKLLHLAGMSPVAILVGKSTNRLWSTLLVFLAQLPFALLCLTLGGLTTRQVAAGCFALAAYLVMIANTALLMSVLCWKSSTASRWTLGIVLLANLGGAGMRYLVTNLAAAAYLKAGWSKPLLTFADRWHSVLSVPERLRVIGLTGFNESVISNQVVVSVLLACGMFSISALVFEFWTRYADAPPEPRHAQPAATLTSSFLRYRPGRHPQVWKDFLLMTGGSPAALAKLLLYPTFIGLLYWQQDWVLKALELSFAQASNGLMAVILTAELLLCSSRFLNSEHQWGTLPNLLLLPSSTPYIMYTKLLGCWLGCTPAWATLVALQYLFPSRVLAGQWLAQPTVIASLASFAVLLHLTVLYSITLRWGAIPAAVGSMFMLLGCFGPVVWLAAFSMRTSASGLEAHVAPAGYYAAAICLVLQGAIGMRLRYIAGH